MTGSIENKLKAMYWDRAPDIRNKIVSKIKENPVDALRDEQLLIRALSTLNWYELIQLIGSDEMLKLLTDNTINGLFPESRRKFYTNAKRLLSKYTLPASG
jgi:hypothetical protein